MNKSVQIFLFGFLVVSAQNVVSAEVVTATMPIDLKEKIALNRIGSAIAGNKGAAVDAIVNQYKMLADSHKALTPHVTRDPIASAGVSSTVKDDVVKKLRSKIDVSLLKMAHGMAQGGPVRTLIDKALNAKVSWAAEGTQLKKFLEIKAAIFEPSLENFFQEMSTTDLYRLVCELKVILETLHDTMPDGRTLLAGLKAHMIADRQIMKDHAHAGASAEVVQ